MTHPTHDDLIRWRDVGSPADRDRMLVHLAECEPCRRQYASLVRLAPEPDGVRRFDAQTFVARGRGISVSRRRLWPVRPIVWVGAAAAAAVLTVAVLIPRTQPPLSPPGAGIRGADLAGQFPVGTVDAVREFRWASPYRATRYRVIVRDTAGATVYEGASEVERLVPTPEESSRLRAGAYDWTVEAVDEAGRIIAASRPLPFEIK